MTLKAHRNVAQQSVLFIASYSVQYYYFTCEFYKSYLPPKICVQESQSHSNSLIVDGCRSHLSFELLWSVSLYTQNSLVVLLPPSNWLHSLARPRHWQWFPCNSAISLLEHRARKWTSQQPQFQTPWDHTFHLQHNQWVEDTKLKACLNPPGGETCPRTQVVTSVAEKAYGPVGLSQTETRA